MTEEPATRHEIRAIQAAIARLRAGTMALVFGFAGGLVMLAATLWLTIRGGQIVGPNLGLLANYFPGYTVTWSGSLVGLVYGALTGGIFGYLMAWIYNKIADIRHRNGT